MGRLNLIVDMKMSVLGFLALALGIAALCAFVVLREPTEERAKVAKSFDRTVAEGMRLWNPKTGVDSFRFDSCRVEKMRLGGFRLGGFNVLCIDGLVLNLPLPLDEEDSGAKSEGSRVKSGGRGAIDAIAGLLPREFLKRAGAPVRSFSGIRINGLAVNRAGNRREEPVFAADEAKNRGRTLVLKNCRVFEQGRTNLVGVARLVVNPAPALVWEGGELRLDDLLPNFNGMKGEEK